MYISLFPSFKAPKPPSGKKSSSARKKLLRIDDQALEDVNDDNEFNIVERPKTRLGNVAFDLFVDTPETGNMKKKPDLLPVLESKRKRSKKVKTKEEIDQKMREVEERRKVYFIFLFMVLTETRKMTDFG